VQIVPALVDRGARLLFVGQGEGGLERALLDLASRFPGRVSTRIAFDPKLARRVFAGADFLMVPSRFEPCGLTQMYAMRYGAIPIVTPVGGLRDTVTPVDAARGVGTGIVARFEGGWQSGRYAAGAHALLVACEDGLDVYRDPSSWSAFVARAMARDSGWKHSAEKYVALYRGLVR
jgi:starch synthase